MHNPARKNLIDIDLAIAYPYILDDAYASKLHCNPIADVQDVNPLTSDAWLSVCATVKANCERIVIWFELCCCH